MKQALHTHQRKYFKKYILKKCLNSECSNIFAPSLQWGTFILINAVRQLLRVVASSIYLREKQSSLLFHSLFPPCDSQFQRFPQAHLGRVPVSSTEYKERKWPKCKFPLPYAPYYSLFVVLIQQRNSQIQPPWIVLMRTANSVQTIFNEFCSLKSQNFMAWRLHALTV